MQSNIAKCCMQHYAILDRIMTALYCIIWYISNQSVNTQNTPIIPPCYGKSFEKNLEKIDSYNRTALYMHMMLPFFALFRLYYNNLLGHKLYFLINFSGTEVIICLPLQWWSSMWWKLAKKKPKINTTKHGIMNHMHFLYREPSNGVHRVPTPLPFHYSNAAVKLRVFSDPKTDFIYSPVSENISEQHG